MNTRSLLEKENAKLRETQRIARQDKSKRRLRNKMARISRRINRSK